jgi:hypothetical protein
MCNTLEITSPEKNSTYVAPDLIEDISVGL